MLCCRTQVREGVFGLLGRCNNCHCAAHPHAQLVRQSTKPNVGSGGRATRPTGLPARVCTSIGSDFVMPYKKCFLVHWLLRPFGPGKAGGCLVARFTWRIAPPACPIAFPSCTPTYPLFCVRVCWCPTYAWLYIGLPHLLCVRTQDGLHSVPGCTPLKGARALVIHSPLKG